MMRRKRAIPFLFFVAALLLMAGAGWYVKQNSVYELENVYQVQYSQGWLYGLDLKDDQYVLFRYSLQDGRWDSRAVPVIEGQRTNKAGDLNITPDGRCLLYCGYEEGDEREDRIIRMDIEDWRISDQWLLPLDHNQSYERMAIGADGQCFAVVRGNGRVEWYRLGTEGRTILERTYRLDENGQETLLFGSGDFKEAEESASDGIILTIRQTEDERHVPVLTADGEEQVIDHFSFSASRMLVRWAKITLAGLAALVCYGLLFWLFKRRKNGFPVWGKMVLALIPFIAVGFTCMGIMTENQVRESMLDNWMKYLANYGNSRVLSIDSRKFSALREAAEAAPDMTEGLFLNEGEDTGLSVFSNNPERDGQKVIPADTVDRLFYEKDGELYGTSREDTLNVPARYQMEDWMYQAMLQAVSQNHPVFLSYADQHGIWYSVFTPVEDGDGMVTGVLKSSLDIRGELAAGNADADRLKWQMMGAAAGFLAAVFLVVAVNLYPLRKVKAALLSALGGNLDAEVSVRGSSEAAGLGRAFNHMLSGIRGHILDIDLFQKKYQAFVPEGELRLMGRKNAAQMQLGDGTTVFGAVLIIEEQQENVQLFDMINGFLSWQIPLVRERGGIVHSFTGMGMECLFTGQPRAALDCAVTLLQRTENYRFFAGMACGELQLGIVGEKGRASVLMVSEEEGLARFLRHKAEEYDAPLLVTSRFYHEAAGNDSSYHRRTLGYIYLNRSGNLEQIYEILDGERDQDRRSREQSRELFEAGVEAFMAGEFQKARRSFILVLSQDERDTAARKYAQRCQYYMDHKEERPDIICLARY